MNILVIGRDPALFDETSESFQRARSYARLFDAYHIVAMMPKGFGPRSYDEKLFLWPTNSKGAFWFVSDAVRFGRKIAQECSIDVIDASDAGESGLAAFLVARRSLLPFRLQVHTDIMSPWYRRASWKEWLRYQLAKFLIPRASCIRVVSQRIKESLLQATSYKLPTITVFPIFTDVARFTAATPAPDTDARFKNYDFKMIAVGRFVEKEKNFLLLIEATREFVKICPKALLMIVGNGPDKKKYEARIMTHGLEKNIILESWRRDLSEFYKSFDLYILSSNYEGWGRTVIEAMAAGLPVVMTEVGLAGEVVKDGINGLVVPVGDQHALSAAMERLYCNPDERRRLAGNAKETLQTLEPRTWEEYVQRYKEGLEQCAKTPE